MPAASGSDSVCLWELSIIQLQNRVERGGSEQGNEWGSWRVLFVATCVPKPPSPEVSSPWYPPQAIELA